MKKTSFLTILLALSLVGCGKSDNMPAIAEVTTSDGNAIIYSSLNGDGHNYSGVRSALANKIYLELADGENATVHFYCDKCEHDETETIEAPFSKMFSCDCPEEIDESGNAREYIAVTAVTFEETDK